jgi:phosphohistidine swiveling domain-containing protein
MWSAKGSFQFDSHFGEIWTRRKNIKGRPTYKQVIFFYQNGLTDCWATKSDRDDLGGRLYSLTLDDKSYIDKIAKNLEFYAKKVSDFIDSHKPGEFGLAEFDEFWSFVYDYYLWHISVKYIVDSIPLEELKIVLPVLEKARFATEPLYSDIENYLELIAENIAEKNSYTKEMIISTTKDELRLYFQNNNLPDRDILKSRYSRSSLIFNEKESSIFLDKEVDKIEKIVGTKNTVDIIEGQTAYKGKIKGIARIVFNPSEKNLFEKGDILVTGMTRPEFLPLLIKAAGFVTDSGGLLSHAAISARELKKPCIIGTKTATKMIKNGDEVEIDADNGVVRIINNNLK